MIAGRGRGQNLTVERLAEQKEQHLKMRRRDFIKSTVGTSIGVMGLRSDVFGTHRSAGKSLIEACAWENDRRVAEMLQQYQKLLQRRGANRERTRYVTALSAAYSASASRYYRDDGLIGPLEDLTGALHRQQYSNGTFDSGNLKSPPDTAFMIEQLCRAQALLRRQGDDSTTEVRAALQNIILRAGEALVSGGVHTPNHRWAICAALAWTHSLYPDQQYLERIDNWLGEGIDQDIDGQYSERSPNYSAHVVNPALLDVAVLLDRPSLLDYVRKNLEMTIFHVNLDGEVETVASRRQDQAPDYRVLIHEYYRPYRYLAIKDDNHRFSQVAREIERNYPDHLGRYLPDFLLFDELSDSLPSPVALPKNYEKHFPKSGLVRIRRGEVTATVFGGSDWHLGHGVWSGLSHNPTFFKLRKGQAILESVRMAPAFFRTGYFRSDGLTAESGVYRLQEERRVPYHQPLPDEYRKEDGNYTLSPDGRFFSKMSFDHRPKDYMSLRSSVTIREKGSSGRFKIDLLVDQHPNVDVAVELCFRKGGYMSGTIPKDDDENGYILREGYGEYQVGSDRIEFGPGELAHTGFTMHGEQYSVHNGGIRIPGYRVYILGRTPFEHTLKIG